MEILRCCVVDDEPLASQLIASYVEKTPYMKLVGAFNSAQEAIKPILEGKVDIVFLDIQMPQLNGMEFAKIIPPACRVIFTTAYENFAAEGFKVNALDYLLKPISYDEFAAAANKALQWMELNRKRGNKLLDDYIIVKSEYKLVQIPTAEILFIEGLKDYVKIYTEDEQKCVMSLMNMKTLEYSLPSNIFMRVHRSYIVNTEKIRVIERNRIIFGKHYIPISDSYKSAFANYVATHTLSGSDAKEEVLS